MTWYSRKPRTIKYAKGYGFLSFARNFFLNLRKIIEYCYLNLTRCCKKLLPKNSPWNSEINKRIDRKQIVKPKSVPNENSKNVKKRFIPLEKKQEILVELRQVL